MGFVSCAICGKLLERTRIEHPTEQDKKIKLCTEPSSFITIGRCHLGDIDKYLEFHNLEYDKGHYSVVLDIKRDTVQNAIDVIFRVIGDISEKHYTLSLLPDSVQDVPKGVHLRIDGQYLYMQYLIAKGYSEYWKGNIFIE